MNPYFQNWNYGYTLGPPSEQTRGAYTTFPPGSGRGGQMVGQGGQVGGQGGGQGGQMGGQGGQMGGRAGQMGQMGGQMGQMGGQGGQGGQMGGQGGQMGGQVKQEPGNWGQVKADRSMPPPRPQMFVSASHQQAAVKQEAGSPAIGPTKPQAVVSPSQFTDTPAAAASLLKLHELAVANRLVEKYDTVKDEHVGTDPLSYKVMLSLGTEQYEGQGPTVKVAKQVAAVQALRDTKYQTTMEQKYSMMGGGRKPIGVTATSELHELATKKGVRVDFKFIEPFNFEFKHSMRMWSKDEMRGHYKVQLQVAGYEFLGTADLPQTAKHNAATQAMAVVRALPDPSGSSALLAAPPLPGAAGGQPAAAAPLNLEGKNVQMALNEIAMRNGCVPEWTMMAEAGPPHQRTFTWQLTMGEFTTSGTGPSKKVARQVASEQMMAQLPEDWKEGTRKKRPGGVKRTGWTALGVRPGTGGKKKPPTDEDGKIVITADNPVSCLFEYAKKVKIPDPEFLCIAENVLETWQKANQTFKKIEYTMQLKIEDKTYLASSNQKKAAKQACAAEAWNAIRATLL